MHVVLSDLPLPILNICRTQASHAGVKGPGRPYANEGCVSAEACWAMNLLGRDWNVRIFYVGT